MDKRSKRRRMLDEKSWKRFKESARRAGYPTSDRTWTEVLRDYRELGYEQMHSVAAARAECEGRPTSVVLMEMRAELRKRGEWPPTREKPWKPTMH